MNKTFPNRIPHNLPTEIVIRRFQTISKIGNPYGERFFGTFRYILVSAAGVLNSLTKDYVSEGQIVIDVSINWDPEKINSKGGKGAIAGDAVFSEVEPIVGAITPVPGGVGSVTTSVLIGHVVEAAERTL